ncbi:MAG: hypothetical protein JRJ38_18490 [Deltaproteobacteria bacterium]|nr:hypothetical protein [Deltaproteobacteria bacterium]
MDIVYAYIYVAILAILGVAFPGVIIYAVVLYFRGRKMGVNKIRRPDGQVNSAVRMNEDGLLRDSINGDLTDVTYLF